MIHNMKEQDIISKSEKNQKWDKRTQKTIISQILKITLELKTKIEGTQLQSNLTGIGLRDIESENRYFLNKKNIKEVK